MRFPEFSGEWTKRKIKNIFENVTRGYVLSKKDISTIKTNIFKYPVYSSQTLNNGLLGYYLNYLYENAITWTTDGANAGEVNFRRDKFYCTNVCGVLLSNNGYCNDCMAAIINKITKKFVSFVGNPKLMNNVMENIEIIFPSNIKEQSKIANFLSLIDKIIELQNKIIKDYELLKKEINIKMFTHSPKLPTLRFKEFKNDLAIKKIKNIVEYSKSGGGTPNTSIKEYYNGTIPFLSISDITVQSKYIYSTNKHITELGLKNSSTWIVPINTVTLTMYASFGIPCIIKNNMCTSQAMYNMIINKNNNYEYVYYYLNFLKNIRYYNSLAEQGSQFNLNSSIIKNINLFLPSLKEQLKIANFLSKLDEILLNVKCEKERLIKNKTFLLQNLFI